MIVSEAATVDGFHDRSFQVVQSKDGHRAGLDALLLAAAVPPETQGCVADLGSGSGVAGLAVINRCPNTIVDLVERDPIAARLARQSLKLDTNNHLASRARVLELDVTAGHEQRQQAGLRDRHYDVVIANPPFNGKEFRRSKNAKKAAAHTMDDELFDNWLKCAAGISRPGARLFMIFRPQNIGDVMEAARGRYGGIAFKTIHTKDGKPASRVLMSAQLGSKAPTRIYESFYLHQDNGAFTPGAEIIFRGRAGIDILSI